MVNRIIIEKEIELLGEKYKVYLKRVPTRISKRKIISTTIRAFIKKIDTNSIQKDILCLTNSNPY